LATPGGTASDVQTATIRPEPANGSADGAQGKSAVVFPGMGASDFAAVGKFMVLDRYARARTAAADEALGYSLRERFRASDADYSEQSQVAFLVNSLALADRAEDRLGMRPDFCTGPSFGQKAAAVYAGAMDFPDVVRLTVELARCEREFFRTELSDVVTHTVVRVPDEPFHELLAELGGEGHWLEISGYLDRGFYMVSLREQALERFVQGVRALGGYSMYTMRPPVHATAFRELRLRAEEIVDRYDIAAPRLPVVADQDGALVESAAAMRTMLLDTFDRPLRWPDVVGTLAGAGVQTVHLTGPDLLFHRLDSTAGAFEVVKVDPKSALRPSRALS
jgi:[acyl-carrier-protein] S-malonyltransferase